MHRLLLESHGSGGSGGGGGNETSGGDGYLRDMNFDANMVIILAALLCALILALGLNSILRCAIRCGCGISSAATATAAVADRTGLKKRELKRFPVAAYGSNGVEIAATECAICLGEFADGERVRVLPPCNHSFHMSCIDTWLVSHSSCPNCRHSLIDLHVANSAE